MRLLNKRQITRLASSLFVLGFIAGYQNCSPVRFSKQFSSESKIGPDGFPGGDPGSPGESCVGFAINQMPSSMSMPLGATAMTINISGNLGNAPAPMKWWIIPGPALPVYGDSAAMTFSKPGSYTIRAMSGDNRCFATRSLVIQPPPLCNQPAPSALSLMLQTGNPVQQFTPTTFAIADFQRLQNVTVDWKDGSGPHPVTQSPVSFTYDVISDYDVLFEADVPDVDPRCPSLHHITADYKIRVTAYDCPTKNVQIMATRLTPDPVQQNAPVLFRVDNFNQFVGGKVTVDFGDGSLPKEWSTNPISHNYPVTGMDKDITVKFSAITDDPHNVCRMDRSYALTPFKLYCVATLKTIDWDYQPRSVDTITNVQWSIGNIDAFTQFYYDLGNGTADHTKDIPLTLYPPKTPSADYYDYTAHFEGKGPGICNDVAVTADVPIRVYQHKFSTTITVPSYEYTPPVRFFFIVDNSLTMLSKQRQVHDNFAHMFDASTALSKFDATFTIFNTTQYSLSLPDLQAKGWDALIPSASPEDIAANTSYYGLTGSGSLPGDVYVGWRAPFENGGLFGKIPGDTVGYTQSVSNGKIIYDLAPVVGFSDRNPAARPTGLSKTMSVMHNSSPSQVITDFNARIRLLDPSNYDVVKFDPITNAESGFCAMARILKHYETYMHPGDQPAFVVVSDENDEYTSGEHCIDSSGQTFRVAGQCGAPGTRFTYSEGDLCSGTFASTSYYSYKKNVTKYSVPGCDQHDETGKCIKPALDNFTDNGHVCSQHPDAISCQETTDLVYASASGYHTSGESCSFDSTDPYGVPGSCKYDGVHGRTAWSLPLNATQPCDSSAAARAFYCGTAADAECMMYSEQKVRTLDLPGDGLACNSHCPPGYCGTAANAAVTPLISAYISRIGGLSCQPSPISIVPFGAPTVYGSNRYDDSACSPGHKFVATDNGSTTDVTTYVTPPGVNALPNYVKSRTADLKRLGILPPTVSTFVYQYDNAPFDAGTSKGQAYIDFIADINAPANAALGIKGFNYDILNTDYGTTFNQLGSFISMKVSHIFNIQLLKGQTVHEVYINGVSLDSKLFYVSATSLVIDPLVPLQDRDNIKIVWW